MGIRIQGRAFQETGSPAFSLFSSLLATQELAKQVCYQSPAVEVSSQLRPGDNKEGYSTAPCQLVSRVKRRMESLSRKGTNIY